MEMEAWLHTIGYLYTGPSSLYGVTFFEVGALQEGQRLLALTAEGVSAGEEGMLDRLAEELS